MLLQIIEKSRSLSLPVHQICLSTFEHEITHGGLEDWSHFGGKHNLDTCFPYFLRDILDLCSCFVRLGNA